MSSSEEDPTVENWDEYNDALVDRGRLTVWISEGAIEEWKANREPQQGAQWIFTDQAIKTCLQVKMVYGLGLRETEGFVESLFGLMGLEDLPVPDYTTLSKRQGDLGIDLPTSSKSSSMHLVIDSTGNRLDGAEGLWGRRMEAAHPRKTKAAHLAEAPSWRQQRHGSDHGRDPYGQHLRRRFAGRTAARGDAFRSAGSRKLESRKLGDGARQGRS
jgi:hypothetical protein